MDTFGVGWIEKFDETGQAPAVTIQCQRAAQRAIQIRLLTHRGSAAIGCTHQGTQPDLQKLDVLGGIGQLQGIESGRLPIAKRQVFPTQGAHQDLQPAILVEDNLRGTPALEHGDEEADKHGFTGSGRTADSVCPVSLGRNLRGSAGSLACREK